MDYRYRTEPLGYGGEGVVAVTAERFGGVVATAGGARGELRVLLAQCRAKGDRRLPCDPAEVSDEDVAAAERGYDEAVS